MSRNVGDVETVSATNIRDADGDLTDPTTLTLKVRKPFADTVDEYVYGTDNEVVRDGLGNFHADIPLDTAGTWRYDWVGEGAATFAEGGRFYCHPLRTT